ncbi:helix-turn-helix domain-containing protein [Burkholderia glumae]|uniref:helix-turn-helix domain-containing protein n=1 Tax=Burkholderia glumae TaxID=337 RepID=UPI00054ADA15|nr:helix-turn-helix transcriptional regulator [Burkholderia glumae]KHJ63616.1 transcriptional regulator [Burkholderia glumae]MCM2481473.1 helix-turn-helix domain-containing protein [Burkholderia glumae]MCM2508387.1 helix-turn-helix domain-containing protein [Burkholderia glumae]
MSEISIGSRLKEERMRIGLSQAEFAALGGLGKQAQLNYESDARSPDANYLAALSKVGVDVLYVVTGERAQGGPMPDDEAELLDGFRQLNDVGRTAVQASINGFLLAGTMTISGAPAKRLPRLAENRAAKLDAAALQALKDAQADAERAKGARSPRKSGVKGQD